MKPDRALRLLQLLADQTDPVGVMELAALLGEPAPSLHRTLQALVDNELATQDRDTKRYQLGPGVLALADSYRRQNTIASLAQPVLDTLRYELHETVFVCQLIDGAAIVVAAAESRRAFPYFMRLGHRMPFHAAASARAILAFQPQAEIDRLLRLETSGPYTQQTMSAEALKQELDEVRRRGYAVCDEEIEAGVAAVAAPIREATGEVVASVAVVAPRVRLAGDGWEEPASLLVHAASQVERGLGRRPPRGATAT